MSTLNWRTATHVVLNGTLIPDPNAGHNLLGQLRNVRVAVEGSFLHIDPRQPRDADTSAGEEFDVHIVPASAVNTITYRDAERRTGRLAGF
ncbi:hypothetical protein EES39_33815 [Streptomyces sp. ADI92-24]|uniref:hypothetical protein n=1 Tax=unclassified Streptomyces TaxID=2593676 RepID=UPI000F55390C|nr:hypothetical protein [Streptomyces sp. ADI92-24]RPK35060.1 hypothetical protein EES39_33815 [Streptomyces sp. ADI92-24]